MNSGQTNGIPEGSVLMDFIAEMILGYADSEISQKLNSENFDVFNIYDYKILRYRDDYRIFVNNPKDGAKIIKIISEVLLDINMKLNASKTIKSEDLITDSVKVDKLSWMINKQSDSNPYSYLMLIYNHAKKFPNVGGLISILDKYSEWLENKMTQELQEHQILSLISIATNIACNNPKTCPSCTTILSILLNKIVEDDTKIKTMDKIKERFKKLPHSGHMEIWLQRMFYPLQKEEKLEEYICKLIFKEPICKLTMRDNVELWDTDWILDTKLKENIILSKKIIDGSKLTNIDKIVNRNEHGKYGY
ncbi:MAG: RNA-directed DNA polymerase [Gammaproteobacteria bacterium WSBS_2016_MAG_OTU1]